MVSETVAPGRTTVCAAGVWVSTVWGVLAVVVVTALVVVEEAGVLVVVALVLVVVALVLVVVVAWPTE